MADRSQIYGALERGLASQIGQSSVAAGWSTDVVVERWSLPPTEDKQFVMARHRLVVFLGKRPIFSAFRDDAYIGERILTPGTVHVLPFGMRSQPRWTSTLEVASFEFPPATIERVLEGLTAPPSEQIRYCRNVLDQTAHALTRRVLAELSMPTERLYGELLCLAMTTHLLRQYGHGKAGALRVIGRLSPVQARRVLDHMHANLDQGLSIAALAREAGLSDAHFARAFHATFKEPPHRLMLRWRLERAARLVTRTGCSLAEAATAAGFCDQAHFANAMRRHFGKSPRTLIEAELNRHDVHCGATR